MRAIFLAATRCVCLVVGTAAVALWVRSYHASDSVQWPTKATPWVRSAGTEPGRFVVRQALVFL